MTPVRHLYVHIPFCPKVCPYCSFYKEASDRNKTQQFLDAVLAEAEMRNQSSEIQPETIFFGGGTPTALSTPQLTYLLTGLRERLDLSRVSEWTLEMNPATVSMEKGTRLRELGVNRVSMGVQAWDDPTLQALGRVHSSQQALNSFRILREAGFENINLDLIFGVPGQTQEKWLESLHRTIDLGPEHISAYCLTYEEDTEFFRRFQRGEMLQDNDADAELFERTMELLDSAGYEQYELSNYAKRDQECRHNLAYWLGKNYVGLGPSAFSTWGLRRWQNIADTKTYYDRILAGLDATSFRETVTPQMRESETIAFGLRTNRGVAVDKLADWQNETEEFASLGLIEEADGRFFLTRQGKMVADTVAGAFV